MLIVNQLDVVKHFVDFLLYCLVRNALECRVELKMLPYSEVGKEDVVLGTNSKVFAQNVLLLKYINPVELCLASRWHQESGQR